MQTSVATALEEVTLFAAVRGRLDKIERDEMRALVVEAWRMCVPKKVAAAYDARQESMPAFVTSLP